MITALYIACERLWASRPRSPQMSHLGAATLGLALLLALLLPAAAQGPRKEDFQTAAPFAILIEAQSGTVLFEKNADQLMSPSSMAKLMTVEMVFNAVKEGRLQLDDEFTISENAWRRGGASSGGSTMYAVLNSRVKVRDLLRGVIIQSGNDACIALAEGISGSEANFASEMTRRARELGLEKSTFTNATGLPDPGLRVTPRELSRLAQHLIRSFPDFYPVFSEREFTWNNIKQPNRDPLLAMGIGADGLKTGFTREAGYGLVGSAVQNGLRLIVVVNGLRTAKDRADEARKLLEWGFRAFEARQLFAAGETVGEAKVYGGEKGRVALVGKEPINFLVPRGSTEKFSGRIVYTGPVAAPVEKGQAIGRLKVFRGESVVLDIPLQAAEDVALGNVGQRAFDAAAELVVGVFRAGADRI